MKYLCGLVLGSLMMMSCGSPVVMDRPTSAILSVSREADCEATTSQTMKDVRKLYEKLKAADKEYVVVKVKGPNGGDYFLQYPVPVVKTSTALSEKEETVAGDVLINHLVIAADASVTWNGKKSTMDEVYESIVRMRDEYPTELYVFINVDEDTRFGDYLRIKEVLYRYMDRLSDEYFGSPYMALNHDDKMKMTQTYVIAPVEYIYDGDSMGKK